MVIVILSQLTENVFAVVFMILRMSSAAMYPTLEQEIDFGRCIHLLEAIAFSGIYTCLSSLVLITQKSLVASNLGFILFLKTLLMYNEIRKEMAKELRQRIQDVSKWILVVIVRVLEMNPDWVFIVLCSTQYVGYELFFVSPKLLIKKAETLYLGF